MYKKRNIRPLRFLPLLMALLLFCAVTPVPAQAAGRALKLGVLPAADSIILHVAVDEGLFSEQGLAVELVPFQSALELGAAMRAGSLDGHFGDIINVLLQRESGIDQAIVATTTHSSPAGRCFGIVVAPTSKAKTLSDLKGADIAISSASIIDFLLTRLLDHEGLPPDHFERQDIRQIPVRLQMLLSGRIEAALLPEPLVSLVEARGARTLLDDRGLDIPLAVIALRSQWTDADTVKRFRAALAEAARRIDAAPADYKRLMENKGLLPKDAADTYVMVRFGTGLPGREPAALPPLPDVEAVRLVAAWMRDSGILKSLPACEDVVIP